MVEEFFNTFTLPGEAGAWLVVTTVVSDPEYLTTGADHELAVQEGSERRRVEGAPV